MTGGCLILPPPRHQQFTTFVDARGVWRAAIVRVPMELNRCVEFEMPDDWLTLDDLQAICDYANLQVGQPATRILTGYPMRRAIIRLFASNGVDFGDRPFIEGNRDVPARILRVFCIG